MFSWDTNHSYLPGQKNDWFENLYAGLLQIVNLTLSENNLTYIPPGAFKTLVALR